MCSTLKSHPEHFRIPLNLLIREGSEVIFRQSHNKKCSDENVIDIPFFNKQRTVPGESEKLSFVVTDDCVRRVIKEWI
jgi:hypothetical protein